MFDGLDCVCLAVWNVEVLALPLDKLFYGLLFWTFLDYTCLGIYLLMDFSMLSRWPWLWTPSLSQSWPPSAASRYPFTLFCRKAALYSGMKRESSQSQTSGVLHSSTHFVRNSF